MTTKDLSREFNPAPKPDYKRSKKTRKERGRISKEVYQKAYEYSGGRCVHCDWIDGSILDKRKWGLQAAHLIKRNDLLETTEHDIAMLCGPSVNTGTCHWWVDSTEEGREWAKQLRIEQWQRVNKLKPFERFED